MKNNKGQALIEFTLILPVILIILLYVVELTRITLKKYELESNMDLIVTLYQEKKQEELNNYINKNNINITYTKQDELTTIIVSKNTNTNLPIIKNNLGKIETKRTIYEKE